MSDTMEPTRVILVDPDPDFANELAKEAADFNLAIDAFKTMQDIVYLGIFNSYQLAILNVEMGQVSGWEIAEYIEKFRVGLPVILLTDREVTNRKLSPSVIKVIEKSQLSYRELMNEIVMATEPMHRGPLN